MRYMVFNLLVVGALAFLLFDGEPPATVRNAVDAVSVRADRLVEKSRGLIGKARPEPAVAEAPENPAVTALAESAARPPKADAAPAAALAPAPAPAASVAPPPRLVVKPKPTPTPMPPAPAKDIATPARPPKPGPETAAKRRPLDPEVAKRRAQVLGTDSEDASAGTATAAEFMAPRVRRSELQKLAEDMELLFVEKVAK